MADSTVKVRGHAVVPGEPDEAEVSITLTKLEAEAETALTEVARRSEDSKSPWRRWRSGEANARHPEFPCARKGSMTKGNTTIADTERQTSCGSRSKKLQRSGAWFSRRS